MNQVLFLCTGNSCRSQMAEAIVNHKLGQSWQAFSAGTQPAGYVHPKAVQVLAEMGIDHHGRSKHVDQFKGHTFDLVITVCDQAAEQCPMWLGEGPVFHRGFQDPAQAAGSKEDILSTFRLVRDQIRSEIPDILHGFAPINAKNEESEDRNDAEH